MNGNDYAAIATVLAGDLATSTTEEERLKVRGITLSLADYFMRENPRFVRTRFYDAVGITEANCEANQGEGRLRLSPDPRSVG